MIYFIATKSITKEYHVLCFQEEVVHLTLNKYRKATHLLQEAERSQVSSSSAADTGRLLVVPSGTNVKNNRSMSVTREVTRVVRV